MLLFPLIYDVFVHEVVKLNSLCLTDVLKILSSPLGGALCSAGPRFSIKVHWSYVTLFEGFYCQTIHSKEIAGDESKLDFNVYYSLKLI